MSASESGPDSVSSFSASTSRRANSSFALSITYSSAVRSDGFASSSSRYVSMWSGSGTSRSAMHLSSDDLPQPLRPSRP